MRLISGLTLVVFGSLIFTSAVHAATPDRKVRSATEVLKEMLNAPARGIPLAMLSEAQGVVIIPEVIKIGFIVGVQRGEGVALIRDEQGVWQLPKFVTITAGSVGWQIGAESSDFVLVFQTRKGVEGLMKGKFTVGADATAAIGPVGRQIGAATDARLSAEIYTYSRSRGLFAGVSLAGSSLDIDPRAESAYYGNLPGLPPARIPESATELMSLLTQLTTPGEVAVQQVIAPPAAGAGDPLEQSRENVIASARALGPALNDQWRQYLALPAELSTPGRAPDLKTIRTVIERFDTIAADPKYRTLAGRAEFTGTRDALARYYQTLTSADAAPLDLPPPPGDGR